MRTSSRIAVVVVFSLCLIGCSGHSAEAMMKKGVAIMNEMCDGIEAGNKETVTQALKKMEALGKEYKELKMSKEEEKRLADKMKPEMEALQKRMQNAKASGKLKPEDMMEIGKSMMSLSK